MPANVNAPLELNQGAAFRRTFGLYDAQGQAIDLTGATARLQIRKTARSRDALIEASTANGKLTIEEAAGKISMELSEEDTELMDTDCVYGLDVTYAGGETRPEIPLSVIRVNPRLVR